MFKLLYRTPNNSGTIDNLADLETARSERDRLKQANNNLGDYDIFDGETLIEKSSSW